MILAPHFNFHANCYPPPEHRHRHISPPPVSLDSVQDRFAGSINDVWVDAVTTGVGHQVSTRTCMGCILIGTVLVLRVWCGGDLLWWTIIRGFWHHANSSLHPQCSPLITTLSHTLLP